MGKLLAFKTPEEGCEDMEVLLRVFYAEEREMRECEWVEEAVRRAKEIPRLTSSPRRGKNGQARDVP